MDKVNYTCPECGMVVAFFEGFNLSHLGEDRHGFQ